STTSSSSPPPPSRKIRKPLADRARPLDLQDFIGQESLVGPDNSIRVLLKGLGSAEESHQPSLFSFILWGPPGSGKTTLARIIGRQAAAGGRYRYVEMSACNSNLNAVKALVKEA